MTIVLIEIHWLGPATQWKIQYRTEKTSKRKTKKRENFQLKKPNQY